MRRIYLAPADCERDHSRIYIKGSLLHYLLNVLRMKEGDAFIGFDGSGYEYKISIKKVDRRTMEGEVLRIEKVVEIEPPFNLHLFQSIPKGSKMDKIISEVAQLGVKKVYPVISRRVIVNLTSDRTLYKKERWQRISAEASKVAGREIIMGIEQPIKFDEAIKIQADIKILFWEKATTSLRDITRNFPGIKKGANIHIFIGPEGGYGDEEISLAEQYGAVNVSMGKRILKVETASVIAVALTIYEIENITIIREKEKLKYSPV